MRLITSNLSPLRALAVLAATFAVACGGDGGTNPPTGTVSVAVAPTSVTAAAGATGTSTATITRGGGFDGAVALTAAAAAGTPSGVTAAFAPASIAAGSTTSTITVTVAGGTAAGTYTFTISAAGSGVTTATTTLTVVVPAPATLALALTPAAVTVAAGSTGPSSAAITRGGSFTGAVTLTAAVTKGGVASDKVTLAFAASPIAAGATSSGITVTAAADAPLGDYSAVITAAGPGGTPTTTATLTVTVVAAGAGSFSLSATPTTLPAATAGGAAVTRNITITRVAPFTGGVTLTAAVTGSPAGVTATVTPAGSNTTNAATVSVTASASALNGNIEVVITGTGTGVSNASLTLTGTVTGGVSPGITLVLNPTSGSVAPGGTSLTSTATITRTGGFTGDVTLSATNVPANVTVTFAPATITAGVTASTVTIAVASGATPGTPPAININAAGTGVTTATAPYTLTVLTPGSLSVALSPAALTIAPGASNTSTATITRGGSFTGPVTLAATNVPSGVTVTFASNPIAGGATTSGITVQVGSGVTGGPFSIGITASGTGVTTASTTLTLNLSGGGGGSVTFTYCAADAPIWVAVQDGTGPWTRVTPTSGNTYTFTVSSSKAGVATVDTVGTGYSLGVLYATVAEFTNAGAAAALGRCGGKTVNGSVANVASTDLASVSLGYSPTTVLPLISTNFQLTDVADGAQDLFAASINGTTQRASKLILRRGLNIPNGGNIPVLDFNASEAFAPASGSVTVTGLGLDTANVISLFNGTRGSAFGRIGSLRDYVNASGAQPFDALPVGKLAAGELQQLLAFASVANTPSVSRDAGILFQSPSSVTVAMGAVPATPTITKAATSPYVRMRVQQSLQADYNRFFTASFSQSSLSLDASITATTGYTGGTAWDLTIPDLSAVSGWLNTWGLQNGTGIDWDVTSQGGAIYFLDSSVADGSAFKGASVRSTSPIP